MFSRILIILPVLLCAIVIGSYGFAQDRVLPKSNAQIQLSFAPLVKQVSPAVVNIYTKRTVTQRYRHPFLDDPFFGGFFNQHQFGSRMRQQVENSLGSGVIIQADGLVVTNAHVVEGADEITVVLNDGRELEATLSLRDEASDLALLRIDAENINLPFAPLKPSETLEVGDIVLAIGNPFGVGQTVTSGIVSAQGRSSLNINDFNFFIQTDAAINPGNSGGPLVALDGGVVGINTAIYSRDGGSLGIGFAIPSEMVASVVAAEKSGRSASGGVIRPWMGVTTQNMTSDIAASLGLDRPSGALINKLHPASPLKEAGLEVGDIVIAVNGKTLRDAAEMKFRMATVPIGQEADVTFVRKGIEKATKVKAMTAPEDPPRDTTIIDGNNPLNGVTIVNFNPAVGAEIGIFDEIIEGVVVWDIERGSPASRFLQPGDIILEINGKSIEDVDDIERGINRSMARGFVISFSRNGNVTQLSIR